jgi:hypothetical protein
MATQPIILPQTTPREKTVEVPANFAGQRQAQSNIALGKNMQILGADMASAAQLRTARTDKIHLNAMEDAADIEFGSLFNEKNLSGNFFDYGQVEAFSRELDNAGAKYLQQGRFSQNAGPEAQQRLSKLGTKYRDLALKRSLEIAAEEIQKGYARDIHKFHSEISRNAALAGVKKRHPNGLGDAYVDSMISMFEQLVLNRHASGADPLAELAAEDQGRALFMNDGFEAIMSSSFLQDRREKAKRFINDTPQFWGYAEDMRLKLNERLDNLDRLDVENKEGDKYNNFLVPIVDDKGEPTGEFDTEFMTNREADRRNLARADKEGPPKKVEEAERLRSWLVKNDVPMTPEILKGLAGLKSESIPTIMAEIDALKLLNLSPEEFKEAARETITNFKRDRTKVEELQELINLDEKMRKKFGKKAGLTVDQILGGLGVSIDNLEGKALKNKIETAKALVEGAGGTFGVREIKAMAGAEGKTISLAEDVTLVDPDGNVIRSAANQDQAYIVRKAIIAKIGEAKGLLAYNKTLEQAGFKDVSKKSKLRDDQGDPTPEASRFLKNAFDGLLGAKKDQAGNSIGLSGARGLLSAKLLRQAEQLILDEEAFSLGDAFAQVAVTINPKDLPQEFTWLEIYDQLVAGAGARLPDGGAIGSGQNTMAGTRRIAAQDMTGILSKMVDVWQNYPGQITGYTNREVIEARWQLSLVARDFVRVFALNPRFPIAEQIMLGNILASPSAFKNPDLVRQQLSLLHIEVKARLSTIKIQLGASAVDPKRAGELIQDVEALSTLDQRLNKFDLVGEKYDLKFGMMSNDELEDAPIGKVITTLKHMSLEDVRALPETTRRILGRRKEEELIRRAAEGIQ